MSFRFNSIIVLAWLALQVLLDPAVAEETNAPPRQVLMEKTVELPSKVVSLGIIKVVFPRGYKTPLHTHESPGPRYVVRGRVKIEEGGKSTEYGAGQAFWESGQWMTEENLSDGETEILSFELPKAK